MVSLEIIEKRGGAVNKIASASEISLTEASVVRLDLSRAQVAGMRRVGNDLVVSTTAGETITVHGFFTPAGQPRSDLVLNGEGGEWLANIGDTPGPQGELAVGYSSIDSVEPLLLQQGVDLGALPWVVGAGLAVGALASGGGGGGDGPVFGGFPPPTGPGDTTPPGAPTVRPTNGGAITGTAEPGAVVTVIDASGRVIGSATAGADGSYSITPATPPADGSVLQVVATDPAGNASPPATVVVDSTPPAAPTVKPTDGSPITGTAEPGSLVTVTDGNGHVIGSATAGADGTYSITPATVPPDGTVLHVSATDAAGNTGAETTATVDSTPPAAPVLNPTDGQPITGTAEPGAVVTLSTAGGAVIGSVTAGPDGTFSFAPVTPPAQGTVIVAVATDAAGNASAPATATVDATSPTPTVDPTDGSPITGTAEPGSVVTVTDDNGAVVGSATVAPNGAYTITPAVVPPNGTVLHVSATDAAGNTSAEATVTVDSVAPAAPVVQLTDGSPITGTAEPGSVVKVTDGNGTPIGSATAAPDGSYSIVPATVPPNGTVLHVTATDASGNTSAEATVTVDSVAPGTPTVNPTDGSPITGTAEPGSLVTVTDAGGTVIGSATAGPGGAYTIVPAVTPANGTVLHVRASDATGNTSPDATTTVDSVAPGAPTVNPTDGSPITGTAEPGAVVAVTDGGGTVIGSATAGVDGRYSITPSAPPPNGTVLHATATDAAGNTGPEGTATVDSVAPGTPTVNPTDGSPITGKAEPGATVTVTDNGGNVVGSATAGPDGSYSVVPATVPPHGTVLHVTASDAAGNASSDATVTVDSVAPAAPTVNPTDGSPITGTAEPGALVTITDGAGNVIGSVTAGPGGGYSLVPATVPPNGTVLNVTATDAAGNTSAPGTATVDSVAPVIAVAIVNDANNDGFINAAEKGPNVTVKVSLVSGAAAGDVIDVSDGTNVVSVTLGAADVANGFINVAFANPAEGGTLAVSATSRDLAGNVSAPATDSATLDTTLATPVLTVGPVTADNVVNAVEAGGTVAVSGTATGTKAGDVVTLVINGVSYSGTVDAGGQWSIAVAGSDLVADADHTVAASVVTRDAAGNTATGTDNHAYATSTAAPAIAIGTPVAGDDRVNAAEDHALVVSGTTQNVQNGQTVTVTFSDGTNSVTVTAVVAGNAWTATAADISGLTNGPVTIRADVQDLALNAATDTRTVTLDNVAPTQAAAVVTYTDNAGADQGNLAGGTVTDDTTPVLNGTLGAALGSGDVVRIYDGGVLVGTATVTGTTWTFATPALANGSTHTYTAVVADAAGNEGTPSAGFTLTVDTTAPTQVAGIGGYIDDAGTVQGTFGSGTSTDDTTPTLTGTLNAPLAAGDTVRIYDGTTFVGTATVTGGSWTFTPPALADGSTHSYTAVVADAAGNLGTPSSAIAITIDTTAPTQTATVGGYTDNVGTSQGTFGSGVPTDDTTPTLNGTLSAALGTGDVVRIYDGATLVGTATVTGTSWTFTPPALADGSTHTYTAVVTDAAGNEGTPSAGIVIDIDTTAPTQTATIGGYTDNVGTVQGSFNSGTSTDDTTPTLNGTLSAALGTGDVVRIYDGATLVGTATVTGTTWTFTPPALADGSTHSYTAVVTDAAGNQGTASAPITLTIDTTAPAQTATIGGYTDDVGTLQGSFGSGTTDDPTPTLTGTLSAALGTGDVVRIYDGTTLLGTATVTGTGWSFVPPTLAEGVAHSYTAVVADAAGNESAASPALTLTLDTTAPAQAAAIATYTDNAGAAQGDFGSGTTTDDTTPVLNGTLTAALAVGDTVRIYDGATLIGTATVTGTSWTFATPGLLNGSTHTYTAVVADAAGNEGTRSADFTLSVTTNGPSQLATVVSYTDDVGTNQGSFGSGVPTDDTTPVLNGTLSAGLAAGEFVRIYDGATLVGTATVTGTTWSFALPALANGSTHSYTAVVTDAAGNESTPSPAFALAVDTTVPVQTTTIGGYVDDVGANQGTFGSGVPTDDTTPVLTGTLGSPLAAGDVVRIYEGTTLIGTATVSGTSWSFATPVLAGGSTHTYTAVVADAAGNEGARSAGFTLTVDTTAPAQTAGIGSVTDNVGTVQGGLASGSVTDDTTPTLNGTLSGPLAAGDTVRIYDGATFLGTATVTGNAWTFSTTALANGSTHSFTAVVADAAGNLGTASPPFTLTVDTTAPVQTAAISNYTDDTGTLEGNFGSGTSTDDTTPTLNGTLSAPLGTGDVVRIYDGATLVGTATVNGASWSFTPGALANGTTHSYTAVVADVAGNESAASAPLVLTVDTTPPSQTAGVGGYIDNVGTVQGSFGSGVPTDDTTPTLSGILSAPLSTGDTVRIYDGATLVGTATVTGTGWTFTPGPLADGSTHSYTVLVADAAGNEGAASAPVVVTIDTTAPTLGAGIVSYTDNAGANQGAFPSGTPTDDTTPVLNGTLTGPLATGDTVRIYDGATLVGTATVSGTAWTFAPPALANGTTHTYTAVVADAAGNEGTPSAGFALTVDTVAPVQTVAIASYADNAGGTVGNFGSGVPTDDTTPVLNGTLSAPLGAGEVVRIYEGSTLVGTATVNGNTWSFATPVLADGSIHTYTAVVADAAGNQGTASGGFTVVVDTTPPAQTVLIASYADDAGTNQGNFGSGTTTDDIMPVLNGTLSGPIGPGDTVRIYEGATLLGTATVTGATWTFAPGALADGSTHSYTAVVTDAVGNQGTASPAFTLTVDLTPPTQSAAIVSFTDNVGIVQGASGSGSVTDDTTPVLNGTLGAALGTGDTVRIYDGATLVGTATVSGTTWTFAPPTLADGSTHTYTAVVADAAGNEGTASAGFTLTVDTTAPAQTATFIAYTDDVGTVQGTFGSGVPTDDTAPVLTGTLSAALATGDTVRIYDGATFVGTATVSGTTWSFATPVLADGSTHSYTAVVADAAGNLGAASAPLVLAVDTTAPTQTATIGGYTDDVGTNQGTFGSGTSTDDTTPTLNGTLSAALGTGDTVRIYDGATLVGTATVTGTTWTFTPPALAGGSTHTYTAVVADAAGNQGTASPAVTLTVDTTAPAQTATIGGYTDNVGASQGTFGSGTSTDDTTPTLNGTLSAALGTGDVVRIYDGATLVGTATVTGSTWTFTPGALANGSTHSYTAVVADAAGNEGTASPAVTLTIDTTPPTQTASFIGYTDDVGTVQGTFGSGVPTDDTAPVLTGTLSAALGMGDVVRIYDGATFIGTATVNGTAWSFATPVLADGSSHSYTAVIADAAGNLGTASAPLVLAVDTTAPVQTAAIGGYTDNVGTNQGTFGSGTTTDDTTPTLTGSLSAALGTGDVVRIYDGATLVGTATVTGTTWTFTPPALANGSTHSYTAVVTDAAGNEGTPSAGLSLTVDTAAPAQTASLDGYTDNTGILQGSFGSGTRTDDTTPTLNGTLSAALGTGDVVRIYDGATLVGTATVTGTTWSFTPPALADGSTHTYTAVVADAAGNQGTPSTGLVLTIDTTAPAQTATVGGYADNAGTVQGTFGSGTRTDDTTPTLNGTLSAALGAGDTVRIYDGVTFVGTATVNGTAWSFTPPALADGSTHTYTAVVTDAAGNLGTASAGLTLTVDTTAPAQTAAIASYADDVGTNQGNFGSGTTTDDTAPVLNGTLGAALGTGDVVRIYDGTTLVGTATVTGTNWTFAPGALANGSTHSYTAVVADAAGNEGTPSAGFTLTIDTTAPTQTASLDGYADNAGTVQGSFGSGTSTDDTTPTLNGTLSAALGTGDVVRVYDGTTLVGTATVTGTTWTFTPSALADGSTHTYTVVVADAAGNEGTPSTGLVLTVDTTAPTQTATVGGYTDDVGTSQGTFGSGIPTDDTTPTLNGTLSAPLAAGDTVRIYDGTTFVGTATVTGGSWTFTPPALADGSTHSYTAVVADAAGNENTASAPLVLTVDTTAPAQTATIGGYTDNVGTVQGSFGSGEPTDDTTPTLNGTLSAALGTGDVVRIYDGTTLVGTATVTGTSWTFTPPALADGSTHSYTAVVTDAAGNEGTPSAGIVIDIDTTAPAQTATIGGYTDNVGTVQGSFNSGTSTDDTTPTLNGTLSAALGTGDVVRIYDGATLVGTATVTGTTWTFTPPALADGSTHSYTAVVTDAAGNQGTASAPITLTIDTTAPAQTATIGGYTDDVGTLQGSFGSGTTDDPTPTLTGTLSAALGTGDVVRIYDGTTLLGTATVTGTGWSFVPPTLAEGVAHSYTAVVADAAGNESAASPALTLTLDTTAPAQAAAIATYTDNAGAAQGDFGSGVPTDDTTPVLNGTLRAALAAGDLVRIYDGATLIGTATVTGTSWSFATPGLPNGSTHTYTAVVADAAGNEGTRSADFTLSVTTNGPSQLATVVSYTDDVGTNQGSFGSGVPTDDTTPVLNGTLSAGLAAGEFVRIYDGATLVGTATVTGTTWSFALPALANGSTHSYTAVVTDAAGNESTPSPAFALAVDTTVPAVSAAIGGYVDDVGANQGTFGSGVPTDDTTPVLTGTLGSPLAAGDVVRIYEGTTLIGTATVSGTSWSFATPVLAGGSTHTYTAVVADAAGNEGARSAGFTLTVDTTAPAQTAVVTGYIDDVGTVQGTFGSGTSTDDTTPTLSGTLSAPLAAGDTVHIYDGATLVGTATVTGSSWIFTLGALANGSTHSYTAVVADAAGNEGAASAPLVLTIDTTAPAQTATIGGYTDDVGTNQGAFGSGTSTDDTTPTLNGTLSAALGTGDAVRIYDGATLVGTATVTGTTWTFTPPALADGSTHSYTAVVADAAGNEAAASAPLVLTVDTTAPLQTAIVGGYTDNAGTVQGSFGSGTSTDDTTPTLNGTLSAALGTGDVVRIYDGATLVGTATVTGTTWTFTPPALSDGSTHSYTAVVADAAGNQGTASAPLVLTVDTTAPAQTATIGGYTDDVGTNQGAFGSGTSTDDTTPTLNGTLSAALGTGDVVRIYDGATLVGTATVTGTTWIFTPPALANGSTHSYTAVVADAAGNENTASAPLVLAVDTTAPLQSATIGGYTDDVGANQGAFGTGTSTDDTTPTLNGTLSAALGTGDVVRIYDGATLVGTATVTGTTWTFTPPALANGSTHSYTAVVADVAGNENTASAPLVLTVDTTAPAQTATIGGYTDNVGTVQGSFGTGTSTDDTTPTLNGTLSAALATGDVVRIYDGATLVGTATVTGTNWTFTPPALADGSTHSYTAVVTDAAGNQGTASAAVVLTIDTTAPAQTATIGGYTDDVGTNQGGFGSGTSTDDTTPTLNGTLSATLGTGDTVRIYDGATLVGTATVTGSTWTFTPGALANGSTHSYTAVVADAAGNEGTASAPLVLTVDTTAPLQSATIGSYTDDVGTNQGAFGSGTSTDDPTPTLNGTLSAALGTGDVVRIYDGATLVGTATVTGTTWTFTPPALANGSTQSYTAVVADAAGNQGAASAALVLTVDTTAPVLAATIGGYTDNVGTVQGSFGSGTSTDDTTPTLTGTLGAAPAAGDVVRIYDGATLVGTATVTGTTWSFTPPALADGSTHSYTALVADAAGNEGPRSAAFTLTIDTTAPAQTAAIGGYTDDAGLLQGSFGSGTSTDDTTPVLTGTLSAALAAGDVVRIYDGATLVGTATVTGTTWTFATPALANGSTHTYTAVVADVAGNQGAPSAGLTLTVDTTPPAQTAVVASFTDDTGVLQGSFGSGTATDDTTPVLNGTLSAPLAAGDTVRIYDGATFLGTATVSGTGWTFATAVLANGSTHSFTAVVADAAGNLGTASAGFTLTIDTTPPAQTAAISSFTDNVGTIQGNLPGGSVTDDTTPVLNGTLSAALATGDTVRIYDGATYLGNATVTGTTWTFAPSALAGSGSHSYTAVVADAAGNLGTASPAFTLTVDTTPPAQTVAIGGYTDDAGLLQGSFGSGTSTDDTTPVLTGTLSAALAAGDTVRIYDGATLVGTATVTGTTWSFATPVLANGSTHTYTAVVADAAGNEGTASAPLALTVDTTPPAQTAAIAAYLDDAGTNQGSFGSGTTTDDTTPVLSGTLSAALAAGDTVRIYEGATFLGTATVTGTTWTFATPALASGSTHTYTAAIADAAGNQGTVSAGFTLTIDTTPPVQTAAIANFTDNVGIFQGNLASGTVTDDTTPVLNGTLSAALAAGDTVRIYDGATLVGTATVTGTSWTFATPVLANGTTHTYTAVVADAAGNQGTASAGFSLTVDTTPPPQTTAIASFTDDVGINIGNFGSGTATDDTTPVLNGTLSAALAAGDTVRIYDGATYLGNATVSGTGWTFATPVLANGSTHIYTAVVTDAAGNQAAASAGFTLTVDTTPPTAPIRIVSISDDTGVSATDFLTNDTTLTVNGTVGTLGTGERAQISINGTTWVDLVVVGGAWSFADARVLAGGTYTYQVRVVDAAGNIGATGSQAVTVDVTPPAQVAGVASFVDNVGAVTGTLLNGAITDDSTPVLNGTITAGVAAGDRLRIYQDGVLVQTLVLTAGQTSWTYAPPVLGFGLHTYVATLVDAAGNETTPGAAFTLTVDALATLTALATDTGVTVSGGFSNSSAVNTDLVTRDSTPLLTGTIARPLDANEVVRISLDGGLTWTTVQSTVGATTWSYATPAYAASATVAAQVRIDNTANGTHGTASTVTYTVDLVAPTLSLTAPALANAAAIDADGDRTIAAGTAVFGSATNGTAEVGTTVALINDVNHDGIYTEGVDVVLGTAVVGAGGAWSISTGLTTAVGSYHLGYVVWDAAGNQSRMTSTTQVDVVPVLDHLPAAAGSHGTSNSTGFGGAMAINLQGNWSFAGDQAAYNGTSRTSYVTSDLAVQVLSGGGSTSYSFFDYNMDGILDIIGTDNNAALNSTPLWTGALGLGYAPTSVGTGLTGVSYGGVAVIDMDGDGFLDAIVGDGAADSASFIKNTAGILGTYGNSTGLVPPAAGIANLQTGREVSGVDLNNDGRVDLALHSTTTTTLGNNNDFTLTLLTNNGKTGINGANWTESQAINDVFATNANTLNSTDPVSLTWADFNNDGWLDLYVNSSRAGTASRVYLNNAGTLSTTGIAVANDTLAGDASVAVDWNGDGRMDAIELDYATGVANLYTNSGNVAAGGWATRQLASLGANNINSIAAADYDWDGDVDLLVGMNGSTATQLVANTNQVKDGTALHLRILNAQGYNVYFGNTVQVFNAQGTLVATQILNPQSGSWGNDSSGIVNVFGLDPTQTYTVKLLANSNGASSTFSWTVTPGEATSAQVLSTTDTAVLLPNVMTGTGYNDVYVVNNVLGGSGVYNGGGGWSTPLLPGETKTWSATGGMDIVDFRNAVAGVGVDLTTNLVTGWGVLGTVNNVEGVRGSALADSFVGSVEDNMFEGRGGNDVYFLGGPLGVSGGNDRLVYNLLNTADRATGGNGSDVANGFTLGSMANAASTDADLIDMGGLLAGYTGTAHVYFDAASGSYVLDPSSAGLLNYIHVTNVGGNTVISVDLNGTGNFSTPLLTLTGVTTSLETLLGNGQLLVGNAGSTGIQSLASFAESQDTAEPAAAAKTAVAAVADTGHTTEPAATAQTVDLAANGQQGHETLLYKLLSAASATGGNGFDEVNGFKVGAFESSADADRIDLSALLTDHAAHSGDPIGNYLQLTQSNGNTVLSIDRDGAGGAHAMTPLLSLNGVSVDLATLLANHQLVVV
ncbi:Ig-like domain-containing protein [Variovorax paradoxus]|uniref:Cell wall-associated protease n=1 Tax=Variovorax paradoxus TaxID=34073 RepID=A0A679J5B7_VARPD|nr:Cell wall-associated protease [Variovorax paradoxus]